MELACSTCKVEKPTEEFHKASRFTRGFGYNCKSCVSKNRKRYPERDNAQSRRYKQENPEKIRDAYLRRAYNITSERFEEMAAAQGYACPVCLEVGIPLEVHHDHRCCPQAARSCGSCIIALACGSCNRGMGFMGDDPDRLLRAAALNQRELGWS